MCGNSLPIGPIAHPLWVGADLVRKEQDTDPLAMDTPTDNYKDHSPNEEKTSADGLPDTKRQNPTTTPAFSTGIDTDPLALDTPTDNYQDHSPNEEKTSADGLPDAKRQNPTTTPAYSTGIVVTLDKNIGM
nr:hypothetical protein BaRGS_019482 [Batillaria attramentaria]